MRRRSITWLVLALLVAALAAGGWFWQRQRAAAQQADAGAAGLADGAGAGARRGGRDAGGEPGSGGARGGERGGPDGGGAGAGAPGGRAQDGAPVGRAGGGRPGAGGRPGFDPNRATPVRTALARTADVSITVDGLGTVTALNTVAIRSRVDGQLVRIAFREGQQVRAGDVIAEVDARPFQVALDQVNGQLARDQALLANARIDLERYRGLLAKDAIARQQVDAQESLVRQYEGTVKADRAQADNAALQLAFARVTAPVSGRLGLRQVDVGNMVRSTDAGGIVTLTQTRPITVVFPIAQASLSPVLAAMRAKAGLPVDAFDRDGVTRLASGRLITVDNLIDATTGTVKLKAQFDNADDALFPNQFVVARLRVGTRAGATLVPSAAVQRGTPGTFVYLVQADRTVAVRRVRLGPAQGDAVSVEEGLAPGDEVVIDGTDKLRAGAKVEPIADAPRGPGRGRAGGAPAAAQGTAPAAAQGAAPGAAR